MVLWSDQRAALRYPPTVIHGSSKIALTLSLLMGGAFACSESASDTDVVGEPDEEAPSNPDNEDTITPASSSTISVLSYNVADFPI